MNYTTRYTPGYMGSDGFIGCNYDHNMTRQERKKAIATELKKNGIKASIRTDRYRSYTFTVTFERDEITDEFYEEAMSGCYISEINPYHYELDTRFTQKGLDKIAKMIGIVNSFNYDESNAGVDYFDCGFYDWYRVKIQ